jgi:GNAT superfamily N-acetyltransferase
MLAILPMLTRGASLPGDMMNTITVRTIEKRDIPEVVTLLRKHARYHEQIEPEHFVSNQTESIWLGYISRYGDSENARIVVAFDGSKVIGLMASRIEAQHSILSKLPTIGMITRAFVEEGYRKQGVSRLLLGATIQWFKEHSIEFVQIGSLEGNEDGTRTWEYLGFRMYSHKLELRI